MNIEALFRGESNNIEYKSALPEQSEKYIKSIIAFANTQGGKLPPCLHGSLSKILCQIRYHTLKAQPHQPPASHPDASEESMPEPAVLQDQKTLPLQSPLYPLR